MISWSTSVKRSIAWRNSPLHELLCVSQMQKVACLTCALICDRRRHPIANQSWLQMPALLDFSISFVVKDLAELEVDPAPAPSLCLRKQSWCGYVVLSIMNDFDEPEISQTRPSKTLPQASPVAACLRPEHTMPGAKQTNCFRFPPPLGV